jgi:hypothetical protein
MVLTNPESVRLVPGESVHALFSSDPQELARVGFFIRPSAPMDLSSLGFQVSQRAGLIRFDDVLLVVTMIKLSGHGEELFDIWWNYHTTDGPAEFKRMAEQERLPIHFYTNRGEPSLLETENSFRKFFKYLRAIFGRTKPWSHVAFDRAIRGFCAQSYPKENLWDTIELKANLDEPLQARAGSIETYPGTIPDELQSYYAYIPDQGHCIKIIPSILEDEAELGNPDEYLHAAPVRTVLRCGIRWMRGHPVAPIPFIPGHGLAVPPDDIEY